MTVTRHEGTGRAEERILLSAGARTELTVQLPSGGTLVGTVVDRSGDPVDGALVYLGIQEHMRGDEPFKRLWLKRRRQYHGLIAFDRRSPLAMLEAARHIAPAWLKRLSGADRRGTALL